MPVFPFLPQWIDTSLSEQHQKFVKGAAMTSNCSTEVKGSVPEMGLKLIGEGEYDLAS